MRKPSFLKLIQCVVLCLLTFTIVPNEIYAQEAVACTKDDNGNITEHYYSIPDAMNASRKGAIHMLTDWDLGAQINIVEGTTSIIYMDGHTIKKSNGKKSGDDEGGIFTLHPNSKLYLYGSTEEKEFTDSKGNTVKSGGLVTGGYAHSGGAVFMKEGSKLYLTNVSLSGNETTSVGGGVKVNGQECEIWMENAHIEHNLSNSTGGGGIYSAADGTRIHMNNKSSISYNNTKAKGYGGGIYFDHSWFSIDGDGTSTIDHNVTENGDGGGVFVSSKPFYYSTSGIITGVNITYNTGMYGGGVHINSNNITLKDVVIKYNTSTEEGGGVYLIDKIDATVKGKVIITDNKRADGADDDVFLGATFMASSYVLSDDLSSTSLIGIRTNKSSDRLVVKNVASEDLVSCFFMNDTKDFHIGYETKDKELWQRKGTTTYAVKVNGQLIGRYVEGTKNVTIVDTSSNFASWNENGDVSLDSSQLSSSVLSFTMPAKDVEFTANYITTAQNIYLKVKELIKGGGFPSQANLYWTNDAISWTKGVDVTWYKNTSDGYKKVDSSDTVQEGVAYMFTTSIEKKTSDNQKIVFSEDIKEKDIKIKYVDANNDNNIKTEAGAVSLSLNDAGTLSLSSDSVVVGIDKLSYVVPIVVSTNEGISKSDLVSLINNNKQTAAVSINNKKYDVIINDISEDNISDDWFDENGLKINDGGYYRIDDISLTQDCNITASIIINVSSTKDIYRLNDSYEQDDTNWYINFDNIEGDSFVIRGVQESTSCNNKTCSYKLTGIKGETKVYTVDVYEIDDYDYSKIKTTYTYILDDSKLDAPTFNDAIKSSDGKSLTVSAYSNEGTIYYLYNDGTNNWTISTGDSTTLTNSSNDYKTYAVKAWASNKTSVSEVSSKEYVIDNSSSIVNVEQINIDIKWPSVGEKLPTAINSIKAKLKDRPVDVTSNLSITSWNPNQDGDTVKANYMYEANIKLNGLSDEQISLLKNYDIVVGDGTKKTYAYVDDNCLHIIFFSTDNLNNAYDDSALSYTLNSIEIGDYTTSLSYEEALSLDNNLSSFGLPLVILKTLNNNSNQEDTFKGDVTYNIISSFNGDYYGPQEIVIEGTIKKPSYLNLNGISYKITLRIKVRAKQGYIPEEVINKVVTCEEYMNSKNWTWSESKKACVYRVSNTSSK